MDDTSKVTKPVTNGTPEIRTRRPQPQPPTSAQPSTAKPLPNNRPTSPPIKSSTSQEPTSPGVSREKIPPLPRQQPNINAQTSPPQTGRPKQINPNETNSAPKDKGTFPKQGNSNGGKSSTFF
jgi:hypothetical protein